MSQVNYNGMCKRDTYDEFVHSLENDTLKLKYLDRSLGMTINSPRPARRDHCTEWDSPPARGAAGRLVLADGTTSAGP